MAGRTAGIARNSCPICGELTVVPVQKMLFRRSNTFRCSVCNGRIIVAESTALMSVVGGLLGVAVALCGYFELLSRVTRPGPFRLPSGPRASLLAPLPVLVGLGAYVACAIPFGRWALRLEAASTN